MKASANRFTQTRINPPQLRVTLLQRQRLLVTLKAAVETSSVTMVSAPAGSGKTTLLVSFAAANSQMPLAWLSIHESDNDPTQFIFNLLAALDTLKPGCTAKAQALLLEFQQAEIYAVFSTLINDLVDNLPQPFTMVLDDVHHLTHQAILKGLDYLIEHMPPQMHVVMAGRHAPPLALARLRVRRQLTEIQLDDLSFTEQEINEFFDRILGIKLSAEHSRLAWQHTEGWAAGVALLGRSAQHSVQQSRAAELQQVFAPLLTQTSRQLFEFLAEEILNNEQPAVRAFLLKTSILPELTLEACAAVAGLDEPAAQAILQDLYKRNIFVSNTDGTAFRYHDLFARFLYERLLRELPTQVKTLHQRAAAVEPDFLQRIFHYANADVWDSIVEQIEAEGDSLIHQGRYGTLQRCINFLPEAMRSQHPLLLYYGGICASETWDLQTARPLLEQAVAYYETTGDQTRLGTALLHLATCRSTTGDISGARQVIEQALTTPLAPHQRAHLLMARAWQLLAQAQWQAANADLDCVLDLLEHEQQGQALRVVAPQWHAQFTVLPGGLRRTGRYCQCATAHGRSDWLRAAALAQMAWIHLWRGEWALARESATTALQISQRYGSLLWIDVDAAFSLACWTAVEGTDADMDQGFQTLFEALDRPQAAGMASTWMPMFLYVAGHCYWLRDREAEPIKFYERMKAITTNNEWATNALFQDLLQGLLFLSQEDFPAAEACFLRALPIQDSFYFTRSAGNVNVLLAYLYWRWQRFDDALHYFVPVLAQHEQENTPGLLLLEGAKVLTPLLRYAIAQDSYPDFSRRLLVHLTPPTAAGVQVPETGEQLTERELEVLRLLATGASNAEIAHQLVISIHTVKIHVAHLLDKLHVPSRQAAAARARDLGIS